MELKVGDYVRTKDGYIGKIKDIKKIETVDYQKVASMDKFIGFDFDKLYYKVNKEILYLANSFIINEENLSKIKSSPNIIDLIEVGDYVNEHKVIEVDLDDIDDYGNDFRYIKTEHDFTLNHWVKENEIETIVTKEQFEQMKYEVK